MPRAAGGRASEGLTRFTLSAVRDELVWIDCEMTGLDLGSDKLIEIAALVTDADLNVLGDGVDVVIHADDAALSSMIEVVAEMHSRSGLIEEVKGYPGWFDFGNPGPARGKMTRYKATSKLLAICAEHGVTPDNANDHFWIESRCRLSWCSSRRLPSEHRRPASPQGSERKSPS